ncbi:MAG TPA: ABC transporter permease [Pyrinomonadaceae bacterium]|nr:ABC transporter permease [Pyrinomonadaceae bacterium]
MGDVLQDLRYGLRTLLKRPGFTLIALVTLALGIGANTAIFSVVNATLLRPLAFEGAERLVAMYEIPASGRRDFISVPDLEEYRAQSQTFEEFTTFVPQSVNMTGTGEPERVRGGFVTSSFFRIFGARPALGRAIEPREDAQGAERVVVLSHDLWQRRFGGDASIVGRALNLNGEQFTVVGIAPEGFRFPMDETEVWMPAWTWPNYKVERTARVSFVLGRLREGATLKEAQTEMRAISARLAAAYPAENEGRTTEVLGLHELVVEDVSTSLWILLGAVGFILLIACANIANLLLARGAARQKEVALRTALGASRWRIVRQLLTETVVLALLGGVLGVLFALWGLDALMAVSPGPLPGGRAPALDARVLLFTLGISLMTGLLFGIVPAWQLSKPDVYKALKEAGPVAGEGGRSRLRGALVVSQVALSLVLLVGAGLLINSFYRLLKVNPGFDTANLLTLEYRVPRNKYSEGKQQVEFHRRVVEAVRGVPGVRSAAVVRALPFSGNGAAVNFTLPGQPEPPKGQTPKALETAVDPHYFQTAALPLIQGRGFTERDTADSPPVVVVNQTLARKHFPGEDPLGRQLHFPDAKLTAEIVGVVGDAKQYQLNEVQQPQVYTAYTQNPHLFATLVARTDVEPMSLERAVKEAVWSVDRDQPVWKVRTVEQLLTMNVADSRFIMTLMVVFAALAVLLTALGIYGVISYSVAQRTHEIGVRMALGAQERDVLGLVLRQGMLLALVGVGIGLAAAFGVTRLMASLLFGVTATDPATYATVALVLIGVALLACFIPARRATKVDPMVALRYE